MLLNYRKINYFLPTDTSDSSDPRKRAGVCGAPDYRAKQPSAVGLEHLGTQNERF